MHAIHTRPTPTSSASDLLVAMNPFYRVADAVDAAVAPIWGGDAANRELLVRTFLGAFCVSFCMLMIWRHVLSHAACWTHVSQLIPPADSSHVPLIA